MSKQTSLNVRVNSHAHKTLRLEAAKQGRSMQSILEELILNTFKCSATKLEMKGN